MQPALQRFADWAVRWGRSGGTHGVLPVTGTADWDMQPPHLFGYKLGFVSENTFSFLLGFLLQRKCVLFQTCCFLKQ